MKTNDNELLASYTKLIDDMLIDGLINIDELPEKIRISSKFYVNYVCAFRGTRHPLKDEGFIRTSVRLEKDIEKIENSISIEEVNKYEDFLMYNLRQMFDAYRGMTEYDEYLAKQQRQRPLLYKAYFGETSGCGSR